MADYSRYNSFIKKTVVHIVIETLATINFKKRKMDKENIYRERNNSSRR